MKNKKMRIFTIALLIILIFTGLSPSFFVTAIDKWPSNPIIDVSWISHTFDYEGEDVGPFVQVTYRVNGSGVDGAMVHMEAYDCSDSFESIPTDETGHADFKEDKWVDWDTTYRIWATKDGCSSGYTKDFLIIDYALHIVGWPTHMNEQTSEGVQVVDQDGNGITCWVTFMGVTLPAPFGYTLIFARDDYPYDVTADDVFEDPWVEKTIWATLNDYTSDSKSVRVKDLDDVETNIEVYTYKAQGSPQEIEGAFVRIKSISYWERYTNTTGSDGKCMIHDFLPDTYWWYLFWGGRKYVFKATHDDYKPSCKTKRIYPGPPTKNVAIEMRAKSGGGGNDCDVDIETYNFDEDLQIHTFEFVATPSQVDPGGISIYYWDFGDGHQTETVDNTILHEYREEPAKYIIRVSAVYPDSSMEHGELDLEIAADDQ